MDLKAASQLREIFASHTGNYPYLLPVARIHFKTFSGSEKTFTAKTPIEAANTLQHILNHDGEGIFDRSIPGNSSNPLFFVMDMRTRFESDQKERMVTAFGMKYYALHEHSHLWIADTEASTYYWQNDTVVYDKNGSSFEGPPLSDVITILRRAGNNWKDVNFMRTHHKPNLQVIENPTKANDL